MARCPLHSAYVTRFLQRVIKHHFSMLGLSLTNKQRKVLINFQFFTSPSRNLFMKIKADFFYWFTYV